jgi:hypothetical protein
MCNILLQSRLKSLLWAIDEHLSDLVTTRGRRPWVINLRCWKALERLLQKNGTVFPHTLIHLLAQCIGATLKEDAFITEHAASLALSIQSYMSMYVV